MSAIRVVGGERFLGKDIEACEETQGLVEIEVADVAAAFLVEQLQRQQRQESRRCRDHGRARVTSLEDQPVEAELGQQRQEQKDTRHTGAECLPRGQTQPSRVGNLGQFGAVLLSAEAWTGRSSSTVGEKKGGEIPRRQSARKRQAIDFRAGTL